jgi:K+-transporting ATPase KdpF subunit
VGLRETRAREVKVNLESIVCLVIAAALLGYLAYAMLRPERF